MFFLTKTHFMNNQINKINFHNYRHQFVGQLSDGQLTELSTNKDRVYICLNTGNYVCVCI